MKLKALCTLLVLAFSSCLYAQLKERRSAEIPAKYFYDTYGLVESPNGGYLVLRQSEDDYSVFVFDDNLVLKNTIAVTKEALGDAKNMYGLKRIGKKIYILYSRYIGSEKSDKLIALEFDFNNNTLLTTEHELASFTVRSMNQGYMVMEESETGNTLLIYYYYNMTSKNPQFLRFTVVDENLNVLSKFEKSTGYIGEMLMHIDYAANDNGDVCISGFLYNDVSAKKEYVFKNTALAKYMLYVIPKGAKEYTAIPVQCGSSVISSAGISMKNNGDVMISGLASSEHTGFSEGSFILTYSVFNERFSDFLQTPFTDELIKMTDASDVQKKYSKKISFKVPDKKGLYNLDVKQVVYKDNKLYVVVEESFMQIMKYWHDANLDNMYKTRQFNGKTLGDIFPKFNNSDRYIEGGLFLFVYGDDLKLQLYNYVPRRNFSDNIKAPLFISSRASFFDGKFMLCYYDKLNFYVRAVESNGKDPKQTMLHYSSSYMPRLFEVLPIYNGMVYVERAKNSFRIKTVKL